MVVKPPTDITLVVIPLEQGLKQRPPRFPERMRERISRSTSIRTRIETMLFWHHPQCPLHSTLVALPLEQGLKQAL